ISKATAKIESFRMVNRPLMFDGYSGGGASQPNSPLPVIAERQAVIGDDGAPPGFRAETRTDRVNGAVAHADVDAAVDGLGHGRVAIFRHGLVLEFARTQIAEGRRPR